MGMGVDESLLTRDVLEDPTALLENTRSFVEQIMTEKDIEAVFQKKIFFPLAPWLLKAKMFYMWSGKTMDELNLVYTREELRILLMFPTKLIKVIVMIRLEYAKKLENPTMMMIDQMLDDFSSYIRLCVNLEYTVKRYCMGWPLIIKEDPHFNQTVIDAVQYLFRLLNMKLLDSNSTFMKTSKAPEMLLKYWDELKNVGSYIEGAGKLIATEFNKLTLRLLQKVQSYIIQQQNNPPMLNSTKEAEKWLMNLFESVGSIKRKLNRFTNIQTKALQNSVNFDVHDHEFLLESLRQSDHFLLYTGGELEESGIYLFASPELLGCDEEQILRILRGSDIGCDLLPKLEIKNSLTVYIANENHIDVNSTMVQKMGKNGIPFYYVENNGSSLHSSPTQNFQESSIDPIDYHLKSENELSDLEKKLQSLGYIVAVCPTEPILWNGKMYNINQNGGISLSDVNLDPLENSMTLLGQGSCYALEYQRERFQATVGDSVSSINKCCSVKEVEMLLQRIKKCSFRCTYNVLNNYEKIVTTFKKACPANDDLTNGIFIFTRDFGWNFLRTNAATWEKRSLIILLMVRLTIDWLSFLIDDCDPTDKRTFRWCVTAMEFSMKITNRWNILSLDETQFLMLKQKIAACMSLLILHFDVMGARADELEKRYVQVKSNVGLEDDFNADLVLEINSNLRMEKLNELENHLRNNSYQVGKILDDNDKKNKFLSSLASSVSNVSIRWQKRKFVGGGTFGEVYSAVNLDTGEVLAVKEIKIQDSKSMEKIFPSIKEEMNVLEMLSHPNIVQYYGVEVHRDRVNIFMEYCEGGSLASLLEHGRIEDEMVTQVYTLQLLEGLAYLHESGIVHRDIKPENILLDFNGIIKYVDFGAARKIAKNGTRVVTREMPDENDDENGKVVGRNNFNDIIGTPMYMAPEAITGSPKKGHLGADDIWALGCVVLEMITGKRPWANLDNEWAIMYHVAAGQIPQLPTNDEVSPAGMHFLKRCLKQNPAQRASAVELLMDPWIIEIRDLAFASDEQNTPPT